MRRGLGLLVLSTVIAAAGGVATPPRSPVPSTAGSAVASTPGQSASAPSTTPGTTASAPAVAIQATPFPLTGIEAIAPAGWTTHDLGHLGLRMAVPEAWHVITTPADRFDDALIHLDVDRFSDVVQYVAAPAAANSVLSTYGLLAVAPDHDGFVVAHAASPTVHDFPGESGSTPAGTVTREGPGDDQAGALVRVQADWSLELYVTTRPSAAVHARDLMTAMLASLAAAGPPATTGATILPGPQGLEPDASLSTWLPERAGGRMLNLTATAARWVLGQPTAMTGNLLGSGNVLDLCVAQARTIDDVAFAIGGAQAETGKASAIVIVCRADGATNEGWARTIEALIPTGPVRASAARPTWHATTKDGRTIGLLAAGRAGVEVLSEDALLVDAILEDMPADF